MLLVPSGKYAASFPMLGPHPWSSDSNVRGHRRRNFLPRVSFCHILWRHYRMDVSSFPGVHLLQNSWQPLNRQKTLRERERERNRLHRNWTSLKRRARHQYINYLRNWKYFESGRQTSVIESKQLKDIKHARDTDLESRWSTDLVLQRVWFHGNKMIRHYYDDKQA